MSTTGPSQQLPLNVLALDAGGVYGLSPLLVLQDLMQTLSIRTEKSNDDEDIPPCDQFDLIAGSGTGGIIAIMIGRLRMSVKDAIEEYVKLSRYIFDPTTPIVKQRLLENEDYPSIYDATQFETALCSIIEKFSNEGPNAPLCTTNTGSAGRTMVLAARVAYADSPPRIFRSYSTTDNRADEVPLWQIARVTSATPEMFSPATVGNGLIKYTDPSACGYSNPSHVLLAEIQSLWPGRPIGSFLSLGCGLSKAVTLSGDHSDIAESFRILVEDSNKVADEVEHILQQTRPSPFFRFSMDRIAENLEECGDDSRVGTVASLTEGYMERPRQKELARQWMNQIVQVTVRILH